MIMDTHKKNCSAKEAPDQDNEWPFRGAKDAIDEESAIQLRCVSTVVVATDLLTPPVTLFSGFAYILVEQPAPVESIGRPVYS